MRPFVVHHYEGIPYREPSTAGEVYEAELMLMRDDVETSEAVAAVLVWLADLCEMPVGDLADMVAEKGVSLIVFVHTIERTARLSSLIGNAGALWDLATGAEGYKPERICDCPKCMGIDEESDHCRLNAIEPEGFAIDRWSYMFDHPEFYNLPLHMLEAAQRLERSRSHGMAAERQKREEERGGKGADEARAIREKHGYSGARGW